MNIHLKEEDDFNQLLNSTRLSILVGSSLYNLNNPSSDKDILHITSNFEDNISSFVWTHHQFQYKKDNVDHLFTTLNQFVRNILTGDSTINFESLFSKEMRDHPTLSFLYDCRNEFVSYNLIRSYLGLAKRDLKMFKKNRDSYKLFHFVRGVETARLLLSNKEYSNDFKKFGFFDLLFSIKNQLLSQSQIDDLIKNYENDMETLRKDLNSKLQSKEILRAMNNLNLMELDRKVISWNQKNITKGSTLSPDIYDSLFTDISYKD